jgi:hypothetical protein
MPANTAKGYPYPLGTDRVTDGDDAIHSLASAVDTKLGVAATGLVTLAAPGGLNSTVSATVTLPAGRFTAVPSVAVTSTVTDPFTVACCATTVTAASFSVRGARTAGGLAVIPVMWQAAQAP